MVKKNTIQEYNQFEKHYTGVQPVHEKHYTGVQPVRKTLYRSTTSS